MRCILMTVLATAALLAASTPGSHAESINSLFGDGSQAGCYKRSYSRDHLKKHPNQTVTMIELAYAPATDPAYIEGFGRIAYGLSVRTRTAADGLIGNVALCRDEAGKIACGMEGDGGAFTVTALGGGKIRLDVSVDLVFETERFISLGSDDKVFVLEKTAARNCQKP